MWNSASLTHLLKLLLEAIGGIQKCPKCVF